MPIAERTSLTRAVAVLALALAWLYGPLIVARDVCTGEALTATVAEEMLRSGAFWRTTAHGEPVQAYPAYPWLVAGCRALGVPRQLALRLPAVASLGLLALLSGAFASRHSGLTAGAVAASVVLASPVALRACVRCPGETLLALLLGAAWLSWYWLGQLRKRWELAWATAMLFVVLGCFTAGARAVTLFYLPFLFLRRPVKGRRRLLTPAHLGALAVGAAVVVYWLRRTPGQIFLPWNELDTMPQVTRSYLSDWLVFPFKCALYALPWPFLMWPAFCMAYRPLEQHPAAFHYLRVIVLTIFLGAWFLPGVSPLALVPLLGPASVLTALHVGLLIRRHPRELRRLGAVLHAAGMATASLGLFIALLHGAGLVRFEGLRPAMLAGAGLVLAAVIGLAALALRGSLWDLPVHEYILTGFAAGAAAFTALDAAWSSWARAEPRAAGLALAGRSPPPDYLVVNTQPSPEAGAGSSGAVVGDSGSYRPLERSVVYSQMRGYHLAACFYLGRPVVRVTDPKTQIPLPAAGPRPVIGDTFPLGGDPQPQEKPAAAPVYRDAVYALSDSGPPVVPEIEWVPLTPPLDLRRRQAVRLDWFPGGLTVLRLSTVAAPVPPDYQPEPVRLYRGVRR